MRKYDINAISARRMNDIINVVNLDMSVTDICPPLNHDEMGFYEYLIDEKREMLRAHPNVPALFENVEYDYDDPVLDIYNETVEEMVEDCNRKGKSR